jgi:hypothetical protein
VGAIGQTNSPRSATDFFHGYGVLKIAHSRAAELRINRNPKSTQVAELSPKVGGESVFAVYRLRARRDFTGSELGDCLTQ